MKIAVYCSAKDCIPPEYLELGDQLGAWIAEQGHTLVYGGATGGLMSRVSRSAKRGGAKVIGVIPTGIVRAGRQAHNCDELYLVENMAQRKHMMRSIADCYICLPGSYGTLDEMMDVIASGTVGEHKKPVVILNFQGYYNDLKHMAEHMRQLAFLPQQESYAPLWADTLDELYSTLMKITQITQTT